MSAAGWMAEWAGDERRGQRRGRARWGTRGRETEGGPERCKLEDGRAEGRGGRGGGQEGRDVWNGGRDGGRARGRKMEGCCARAVGRCLGLWLVQPGGPRGCFEA